MTGGQEGTRIQQVIRRLMANWARIFSGNLVAAGFAIVAVSLAARALGPADFGILILILTYVRLVDGLVNFQSAQALIKFGVDALLADDRAGARGLIRFGFLLDGATALAATLLAALGLLVLAPVIGLEERHLPYALVFCLLIPTNLSGAPTAILRLLDRFGLVVSRELTNQVICALGSLVLFVIGAPLYAFVLLWLVAGACGNLTIIVLALRELRRRDLASVRPIPVRAVPRRFPGLWPALVNTNLTTGLRLLSEEGDVLLVGAILGPASAGILRLAKQFASVLPRVGRPIQDAVYPDLARLWGEGARQSFVAVARRVGGLSGAAGLVLTLGLLVLHRPLIELTAGPEFLAAGPVLVILALAHVIYLTGITVLPVTLTLKRSGDWLLVTVIATLAFLAVFPPFLQAWGLLGAAAAHIVYNSLWLGLSVLLIRRALQRAPAVAVERAA